MLKCNFATSANVITSTKFEKKNENLNSKSDSSYRKSNKILTRLDKQHILVL